MSHNMHEIVTFKADRSLLEAMEGISNRSKFIREAILSALESVCPLCMGTGILTPRQQQHWRDFERTHSVVECPKCHEMRLTCSRDKNSG